MTFYRTGHGLFHFGRSRSFGLDAAKDTLLGITKREGGIDYLRRVLGHEMSQGELEQLGDGDVVFELAKRVSTGALTILALRPKDSRAEGFFLEAEAQGASSDQQNKAGDLKPAPVVPPEYPVLARVEADEVIDSTAGLCAELVALLFGSFGRDKRPSTIAQAFVAAAAETSRNTALASRNVDILIGIELYPGGDRERPKPAVPVEFVSAAKSTGERTKMSVEALAASLGDGGTGAHDKPAPAVPETYVAAARGTAQGAKGTALSLGESLVALFPNEPFVRARNAAEGA